MNTVDRRRSGRRPLFSGEDVVRIALDKGLDSLSMGFVAKELGVAVASVYRRFPSRDALLTACIQRLISELDPPDSSISNDIEGVLRQAGNAWYRLFCKHPDLARVMKVGPKRPGEVLNVDPSYSYIERLLDLDVSLMKIVTVGTIIVSAAAAPFKTGSLSAGDRDRYWDDALEVIVRGFCGAA